MKPIEVCEALGVTGIPLSLFLFEALNLFLQKGVPGTMQVWH